MRRFDHAGIAFVLFLLSLVTLAALTSRFAGAQQAHTAGRAADVNPMIGTGSGPGSSINVFPGPSMPFGMVQLSPDTEDHNFGYHYDQINIRGFSMTHMSGVGCANSGDVFFTATTGPVYTELDDIQSPYSHQEESASPGYYRVNLLQWDIDAQLSATERTGVAQFTFPAGRPANILVPISHTLNETASSEVHISGDRQISGFVQNHAFCGSDQTYRVYFVMTFSEPFSAFGTWSGPQAGGPAPIAAGSRDAAQTAHMPWIGAYATWAPQDRAHAITAKIAISYVDPQGAENNLKVEAADKNFTQIHQEAEAAWNKALSVIDVTGGSQSNRTVFYTALYHSLLMPGIYSDADGRYLGFDGKIHQVPAGHEIYANFSGWDIYRSQFPLLAMVAPQRAEDMAQSIVLMDQQGGWIDRWPQLNRYTNVMAGSPLTIMLSTAWLHGLHGFDIDGGWAAMVKDATQAPPANKPYVGEEGIAWINQLHYVPDDKVQYGSVSQLQEDTIAYASLYRLAVALGKSSDASAFYDRALYYRNVFNHEDRLFRPRNADGQWAPSFDPNRNWHGFIEGSAWQYQWLEPFDVAWVVKAMGTEQFNQRLSEFFAYKMPVWYTRYYTPYNETDLEAPYEFHFSGRPWETQRIVRRVLDETYTNTPNGIPGNDDCGAMSAWAVLNMMGIYSIDPPSLAYELVAPSFTKVVLHLQAPYKGQSFTIEAHGAAPANPYIQSVQLNGQPYRPNWIGFSSIASGGTLHFELGPNPNRSWGTAPGDAPPSLSDQK